MDANGQMRYLGKSSGYYLLQSSRTYQNGAFHFASYGKRRKRRHNPKQVDPFELPPKDLSEHLIVLYFQHFYPFLPLFFQRRLFSSVEQEVTPLLLNSIYAVASRISDDVRVRSDPAVPDTAGDVFFERAEKLLDESYDKPSISTVQSLLLLASHQHGAMRSARAWLYSGMAFRMAQDLGLHRNCDYWNLPPEECERRKRVFWCCYVVDRLGSAMYGRATTFEERDCDVPFPSVDDDESLPSVAEGQPVRILDNFINLIKICDILGHVLKNIYYVRSLQNTGAKQADSVLNILNKRLHQWHDQLPNSLRIQTKSSPSVAVCQLHMIYYTTLILLHRPFTRGPDQTVSIPSLLPSASILASAADSMLSILDQMFKHNQLVYVLNFSVYYIFTVGLIFVRDASNHEEPAESKLNKCMEALNKIETTWITASKNCQILAELAGYHHPEAGVLWSEDPKDRWIDFTLDPQSAPITTTLDPFEAPGIIPIKPFGYWESSLDDWNHLSHQEDAHQKGQHLIHTDQHVDVLTGVSLDASDKSNEKSFMDYLQGRPMNQQTPEDGGPSVIKDLANAYYW
ncbi:hypothetical protein G6F35_006724 [Rhizopus arrhizus]|nr:hypothetical protein G6F35_006724 [Rhizopus arrhizus]